MHTAGAGSAQPFMASFQGTNTNVLWRNSQQGRDFSTALAHTVTPGLESSQPCSGPECPSTLQRPCQPHPGPATACSRPDLPLTSALLCQSLPGLPQRAAFPQPQPALPWFLPCLTLALPHSHSPAPRSLGCVWARALSLHGFPSLALHLPGHWDPARHLHPVWPLPPSLTLGHR